MIDIWVWLKIIDNKQSLNTEESIQIIKKISYICRLENEDIFSFRNEYSVNTEILYNTKAGYYEHTKRNNIG